MAFERATKDNYNMLRVIPEIIETAERDPAGALGYYRKRLEEYWLAKQTITVKEILCLDEGFLMVIAGAIFRSNTLEAELNELLQQLPVPEVVINVSTPTEVCLLRDRGRENPKLKKSRFNDRKRIHKRHQRACQQVLDVLPEETKILTIQGTKDIDRSTAELQYKLEKHIERKPN